MCDFHFSPSYQQRNEPVCKAVSNMKTYHHTLGGGEAHITCVFHETKLRGFHPKFISSLPCKLGAKGNNQIVVNLIIKH